MRRVHSASSSLRERRIGTDKRPAVTRFCRPCVSALEYPNLCAVGLVKALGGDPNELHGVRSEKIPVLPFLFGDN